MKKIFLGLLLTILSQSLQARYYDPDMGRFASRDPIEYIDGMNLYAGYFAQSFEVDPMGTMTQAPDRWNFKPGDQVQKGSDARAGKRMENNQDIGWQPLSDKNEGFGDKQIKTVFWGSRQCKTKNDVGSWKINHYKRTLYQTVYENQFDEAFNEYFKDNDAFNDFNSAKDIIDKLNDYKIPTGALKKITDGVQGVVDKAKDVAKKYTSVGHVWSIYRRNRRDKAVKMYECTCDEYGSYSWQLQYRVIRRGKPSDWTLIGESSYVETRVNEFDNMLKRWAQQVNQLNQSLK